MHALADPGVAREGAGGPGDQGHSQISPHTMSKVSPFRSNEVAALSPSPTDRDLPWLSASKQHTPGLLPELRDGMGLGITHGRDALKPTAAAQVSFFLSLSPELTAPPPGLTPGAHHSWVPAKWLEVAACTVQKKACWRLAPTPSPGFS